MKLSSKSLKIVCPIFGIKKPYSMFFSFTIKNPKLLKMEIKTNFGILQILKHFSESFHHSINLLLVKSAVYSVSLNFKMMLTLYKMARSNCRLKPLDTL